MKFFFSPTASIALEDTLDLNSGRSFGPQLKEYLSWDTYKVELYLHWPNAGEFHNSVPAQLSPSLNCVASPYPTSTARVNTVLPLKIVSVETGVPGEKPPQGVIGLASLILSSANL